MRTKHLLMTMALPLAFAACTSDEFESFDQGNGLKNRKEIGQVAIAFENGDALTRWTSGMQPEVGDRVGAVSIDNLKKQEYNEEKPESNYTTSENQIFSNYMYENNGNDMWLTNANLVEGGYYFYAPYVASQTRGLMKLNAPVVQNLDVQDGKIVGNSAIVNFIEEGTTPFYIGYKFLSAAESNTDITVKMRHIFAYPRLEFTNKTGEAVELKRILIQYSGTENKLIESASLSNTGIGNIETPKGVLYMTGEQTNAAIADAVAAAEDDATAPFNTWGTWSKTFAQDESLENLRTADLLTDVKPTSVIRIELESPVTVADDATISFGVVLPAAQFANGELQVNYVTTDDEAYTWKNDGTVTTMLGDAYVAEDYNEDGSGDLKNAEPMFAFEATKIDNDFEMVNLVTSTQELIDVIDANRASTTPLVISLAGEDIEFNEAVYNAVSRQKAQGLTLNGTINIIGGADAENALTIERGVKFDNAIVKKGYVAFDYSSLSYNTVKVEEGAVLAVNSKSGRGTIENYGTLQVATTLSGIKNYANVEVLTDKTVAFETVANDKAAASTVTYGANAEATLSGAINYNVVNNGTLIIANNAVLTSKEVVNNVTYTTTFTNNGEITLAGTAANNGTLTNEGTIYGTGVLTNAGTVNNNNYIQCPITNAKVEKANVAAGETQETRIINAKDGSRFIGELSGSSEAGNDKEYSIINVADKASINAVDGTNVSVTYTVNGTLVDGEDTVLPTNNAGEAIINTLNVSNVSLTNSLNMGSESAGYKSFGAVEKMVVTGNINITPGKQMNLPEGSTLYVNGNVNLNDGAIVWKGGTKTELGIVEIAAGKTFTNRGTIDSNGAGVTIQSETVGTAYGKFNNLGTVANSTNIGDEDWWVSDIAPVAEKFTASTAWTRGGIYELAVTSEVISIALDKEDRVKLVKGEGSSLTISKDFVKAFNGIGEVIVGEDVTLNLGITSAGSEWADSEKAATVPTNIIGKTGSHVVVTYSSQSSKTYDWNGSAWVEQEAGI